MLPIPIFLVLVFSVAVLAPAPAILIHLMKTISLSAPPSHFPTMPALPSTFLPSAVETLYLPVPSPQLTLNLASVCHSQSIVDMTLNSTRTPLQAHEASGYTTSATILPVVVLAMINCLVYRLLVDDTNGTRSGEESEQPTPVHFARFPSEEPTCYYKNYEIPSPWPVVDTNILTSGSSEHDGLSDVVTVPSCLELGHGPQSSGLFEQISQVSEGVSYGNLAVPEKASHDSSLATLSVSDCTSCNDWTPTAHSTGSKGPSSAPIVLVAAIKYSELVPPQGVLDMAVKTDVNLSSAPLSRERELERKSEPQDNSTLPSTIESACAVNDVYEAPLSYDPDDDGDDETFDYQGIDWEPRASGVPTPPPSAKICAIALPYSSPEPHFKHSRTPSKAEHESTSWISSTSALSITCASDDIQVGIKCRNEAKIAYGTRRRARRASANDLRGMADRAQVTPSPGYDSIPVASLYRSADECISIDQVALPREDLPVFTSPASAMNEEVTSLAGLAQPVIVGLKASIYAPRSDDLSREETQECAGTLGSMHATSQENTIPIESQTRSHSPELVSAADGIQEPTYSVTKPGSLALTYPAAAESSTPQASELNSSTFAPAEADVNANKEPAVIPVPPTPEAIVGSDVPRGLAASIHAPGGCPPSQAKRGRVVHSADAPNWAAAATEDYTAVSRGSGSAQRGKPPNQRPGDGDEPVVPTASRCVIQDENEEGSGVHDSDGSTHPTDNRGATCPYETDSGLDAADDSNEQESATRSQRSRRRGKPRRPRTKVPYLPPPRMRNLTQHPATGVLAGAQALHKLAAGPAVWNEQHHSHTLPQQPGPPTSVSGPIVPPQTMVSDQLGKPLGYHQTPQHHTGSLSVADHLQLPHISSLQSLSPPAPYYLTFYTQNPHGERATSLMP